MRQIRLSFSQEGLPCNHRKDECGLMLKHVILCSLVASVLVLSLIVAGASPPRGSPGCSNASRHGGAGAEPPAAGAELG